MIRYKENWSTPSLDYDNQVKVKTLMGGICATDLHMLSLHMSSFASIMGGPEEVFPMGHECIGIVEETGEKVENLSKGDRVALNPFPSCEAYGYSKCKSCKEGNEESCIAIAGVGDGSNREEMYGGAGNFGGMSGGGYCEYFKAFEKQLYRIPQSLADEIAVLIEPFSVGLHAAARSLPKPEDTVLVFGAGTIGLMVIAALRLLNPQCRIVSIARYPFQKEAALRLGANEAVLSRHNEHLYEQVVELTGGKLFKPMMGKKGIYGGEGADMVFDCVATETSLDDALHLVRSNGTIIVVGQGYTVTKKVDWSIQVLKEIEIRGSIVYGTEQINDKKQHTFEAAINLMDKNSSQFEGLVTHTFRIEDYKSAITTASLKGKFQAIKAAFDFR
jgi:threonine dehydrogenase-like Zn-dependent dehydrogenase